VNAVKAPLAESYFASVSLNPQVADSTIATFSGTILVEDGRSTGMMEVVLSWTEWLDDPTKPEPTTAPNRQRLGHFRNFAINQLPTPKPNPANGTLEHDFQMPATSFKFNDTRHRRVDISVVAISRFKPYFEAPPTTPVTKPPQNSSVYARASSKVFSVSVLNTALPAPPTVSRIKAIFPVSDKLPWLHHSLGGGFRVHLDRGWYSSGEGELVGIVVVEDEAVVCSNTSAIAWMTDPLLSRLYTRWGADPARDLTGLKENINSDTFPPAPVASDFFPPPDLAGFDTPVVQKVPLAERPTQIASVLTYQPMFSAEDGWYCDIILKRIPTYGCFLRLALVRYQPQSIALKHLSKVALAGFVQLRADRSILLLPSSDKDKLFLFIQGTRPGLDIDSIATTFSVEVEVQSNGVWIADIDTDVCIVDNSCPESSTPNKTTSKAEGPVLAMYVLKIHKDRHRRRRARVSEFEARRTYDPITLKDVAGAAALVYSSAPLELPEL
jgi:hypothetical protein